jgi:hypothetical protein
MDYDVSVISLDTPPSLASLTTYRPAVSVRNNGRFPATASGTLSAYKAGRLIYSSSITSPSIQPGESGLATAADDWTPDAQGDYHWFGYLTTFRDQVPPNGFLAPVLIHVGPEPPTPPPAVPNHHQQHEHGGSDVVDVDNLPGLLRDAQIPTAHASAHQAAGVDQLNVAGLTGVLGDPQIPTDHGNEHHSPDFATASALSSHLAATTAHAAAANLANRETSGDKTGLVPSDQLANTSETGDGHRFLSLVRSWDIPVPTGLICLWLLGQPIPANWELCTLAVPAPLGTIYIVRLPEP